MAYSHVGYIALLRQLAFLCKCWVGDHSINRAKGVYNKISSTICPIHLVKKRRIIFYNILTNFTTNSQIYHYKIQHINSSHYWYFVCFITKVV